MENTKDMAQDIAAYSEAAGSYQVDHTQYTYPQEEEKQEQPIQEEKKDEQPSDKPVSKSETTKEYNFRALREQAEASDRRAREAEERIAAYEKQLREWQQQQQTQSYSHQSTPQPQQEDFQIDDDDIPTWGQQKQFYKKIEKQLELLREETQKKEQKRELEKAEDRIKAEHPDIERVLSKENIDMLRRIYPHDYRGIEKNDDPYAKLKMAYNMIKNYGILEESATEQRVTTNYQKPRPASAAGAQNSTSPLGRVDEYGRRILSEQDKDEIMRRSRQVRGLL